MKKQILFVDDDGFVLSALRRLLFSYRDHWDVDFIRSGEKALRCMQERPYDVVVSDMRMPGMDGAELLENVRQRFPASVRIILSGQTDDQVGLDALGPAHQYFAKPCDPQLLKETIHRLSGLQERVGDESMLHRVSQLESLPSLPSTYSEFQSELASSEPSVERVADLVTQDIAMTAKVLQLVSSTIVGLQSPITDPIQAVKFLGIEHLQPLARSARLFAPLDQSDLSQRGLANLTERSRSVASLAREIAMDYTNDAQLADDAYLSGMLQDVGQLIMSVDDPQAFEEMHADAVQSPESLSMIERRTWRVTHADLGAYLCGLWGLPDSIVQAVAYHHVPLAASESEFTALTAVHLADGMVAEQRNETEAVSVDRDYVAGLMLTDYFAAFQERRLEASC